MCDCPACSAEPMRFFGGPIDGMVIHVPRNMPRVNVPALLRGGGYVVAVYDRHELTDGAAMVCPGVWPLPRARE